MTVSIRASVDTRPVPFRDLDIPAMALGRPYCNRRWQWPLQKCSQSLRYMLDTLVVATVLISVQRGRCRATCVSSSSTWVFHLESQAVNATSCAMHHQLDSILVNFVLVNAVIQRGLTVDTDKIELSHNHSYL